MADDLVQLLCVVGTDTPMNQQAVLLAQGARELACQVTLEELAPVMHVHESWQDPAARSALVRSCRCRLASTMRPHSV